MIKVILLLLETGKKNVYETRAYNRCTNFPICLKVTGSNPLDAGDSYNKISWIPPPTDCKEFNTDSTKVN